MARRKARMMACRHSSLLQKLRGWSPNSRFVHQTPLNSRFQKVREHQLPSRSLRDRLRHRRRSLPAVPSLLRLRQQRVAGRTRSPLLKLRARFAQSVWYLRQRIVVAISGDARHGQLAPALVGRTLMETVRDFADCLLLERCPGMGSVASRRSFQNFPCTRLLAVFR